MLQVADDVVVAVLRFGVQAERAFFELGIGEVDVPTAYFAGALGEAVRSKI